MAMSFFTIKPANWKILHHTLLMGLVCFFLGSCSSTWNLELEDILHDDYLPAQQSMDIGRPRNSPSLEAIVNMLEEKCVTQKDSSYYHKLLNAVLGIKVGSVGVEQELSYGYDSYSFPSAVFLAAYLGEQEVIAWLVENYKAQVGKISNGCIFTTVLHAACRGTNLPTLGYLFARLTIEKKSPIAFLRYLNTRGNTYFSEAVATNNVEFVRELINQLKRYQKNPGHESEWAEVVNIIVSPSLIGKQRTPSAIAIACGNMAMLSLLKEHGIQSELEKMSIEYNNIKYYNNYTNYKIEYYNGPVKDLVKENTQNNRGGDQEVLVHFEKIFNARKQKRPAYYQLLLDMMANILRGSMDINAQISRNGLLTFNPLCLAVYLGEKEAVEWLLSQGAKARKKISSSDKYNNKDALCIAFEQRNIDILHYLLIHVLGYEKYASLLGGSRLEEKTEDWFTSVFKTEDTDLVERTLIQLKKRSERKTQQSPDSSGKAAKSPRKIPLEASYPQRKRVRTVSDKKRNEPIDNILDQLRHKTGPNGTNQEYYEKLIEALENIKKSDADANHAFRFRKIWFPNAIFFAAYADQGDSDTIDVIRWLVEKGAEVSKPSKAKKCRTVFHLVCTKGINLPLLEYLVERLLNEKNKKRSPSDSPSDYLLTYIDNEHDNCLNKAIKSNNLAFVRRLVAIIKENSASPTDILELIKQEIPTPLKVAQDAGNLAMQKLLVDEGMYTEEEKPLVEQIRHIHAAT